MLKVRFLRSGAKAPTIAHPGEDLAYDIYAAEDVRIAPRGSAVVPTAIAIELTSASGEPLGALLRDKSSMAARRLALTGGVIDAGYRGEIKVLIENLGELPAEIHAGDKLGESDSLSGADHARRGGRRADESSRNRGGFGSSGRK